MEEKVTKISQTNNNKYLLHELKEAKVLLVCGKHVKMSSGLEILRLCSSRDHQPRDRETSLLDSPAVAGTSPHSLKLSLLPGERQGLKWIRAQYHVYYYY